MHTKAVISRHGKKNGASKALRKPSNKGKENWTAAKLVKEDAEILAITSNVPNIRMQENDKDCWEIVLTEEERQLIDEFLQT